jgi:cell division protein FtsB
MKALSVALVALIVLIQYPLWVGKGGWLRVWEVDREIKSQRDKNAKLQTRNSGLEAEVRDLSELGMIKQDEVFFQVLERGQSVPAGKPASPAPK